MNFEADPEVLDEVGVIDEGQVEGQQNQVENDLGIFFLRAGEELANAHFSCDDLIRVKDCRKELRKILREKNQVTDFVCSRICFLPHSVCHSFSAPLTSHWAFVR